MKNNNIKFYLLILFGLGLSVPATAIPPNDPKPDIKNVQDSNDSEKPKAAMDALAITDGGESPRTLEEPDVHPFTREIAPYLSLFYDLKRFTMDGISDFGLGFKYGFERQGDVQWEVGASLLSHPASGRFMFRRRVYFEPMKKNRPYYTYGLGVFTRPEDSLFFATRLKNYTALGSLGIERSLAQQMSLWAEFEVGAGTFNSFLVICGRGEF